MADPGTMATSSRQSLLHYAPVFVLFAAIVIDANQITDPDLWWHLTTGRMILSTGHFPSRDLFSYTAFGHRWLLHEWLAEVTMVWAWNHFGMIGLKIVKLLCSSAIAILLADALAETGASISMQFAILVLAAIAVGVEMRFRPQMFDFAAMSAIVALLTRHNYRGSSPLWIIVPIMAVWGNLHGGFIVGLAALAAYGATLSALELYARRWPSRGIRIFLILALSAAATLINPLGFTPWQAVIVSLRNPNTHRIVSDWYPLVGSLMGPGWGAKKIYYAYATVWLGAECALFAVLPWGSDLPLVAVAALMGAGALAAIRNIALAAIAGAPVLARRAALLSLRYARAGEHIETRRGWAGQGAVAVIAVLFALQTAILSPRLVADIAYPAGAVAFAHQHNLRGNVLNDFGWGDYLIWHMHHQMKIFCDGRYDLVYPPEVVQAYLDFASGVPTRARKALAEYPPDFILFPPDSAAARFVGAEPGWKLIYRDRDCALFARADSPAAQLPGVPISGTAPAVEYFP